MSVFGGDSWGREAQCRKRRVDDLLIDGIEASAYKRLANGKFACLVCPQNPVLDTPIMLSVAYSSPIDDSGCNFRGNVRVSSYMRILVSILLLAKTHVNGSRHKAAESRHRERELYIQQEAKKRSQLPDCVISNRLIGHRKMNSQKPLIKRARKAASEVFLGQATQHNPKSEAAHSTVPSIESCSGCAKGIQIESTDKGSVRKVPKLDYREQVERELKFTAAGWKRDCHGRWFKDENAEFDSDEEDPNLVLNDAT
ncbi:sodium channel modifier 1 [Striga asiatica]|uniref:Sodium channel modifier 1 n=1 Tax=Striga asiatica TaxID=4170 RepID=A0A5A7QAC5_STRAF|nr:sodium channel modifier 1 [Striga asiatica]